MQVLGREAKGSGCIYFTGGASALLIGWRSSTVDVDIRLDPEPSGIFQAIGCIPVLRVARAKPAPLTKLGLGICKSGMHPSVDSNWHFSDFCFNAKARAMLANNTLHKRNYTSEISELTDISFHLIPHPLVSQGATGANKRTLFAPVALCRSKIE